VRKVRLSSEQKGRHEHGHLERQWKVHPSSWITSTHRTCPVSAVAMRKARLPIGAQEGAIVQNFTTGRHDCYQPGGRSAHHHKYQDHHPSHLPFRYVHSEEGTTQVCKNRKGRHNHRLLKKRQWKVRSLSWIPGNTYHACPISLIAMGKARLPVGGGATVAIEHGEGTAIILPSRASIHCPFAL